MQLNVLDDLAEAMKALDGKKTSSCSIALKIQLDEPSARGTQESP